MHNTTKIFLFVEIILLVITNPALSIMLLRYDDDKLHAKKIGFDDHYITLISELTPYTWVWCQHVESQYIYRRKKKTFATYSSISTLNPMLGIPYPFFYGTVRQKKLIVRFCDPKKSREPKQHYVADI